MSLAHRSCIRERSGLPAVCWALFCVGTGLIASSFTAWADTLEISYSGSALYAENCSACHGISAGGDGPVASIIAVPVPDLRRLAARNGGAFPAEAVATIIDGRDADTPAHGDRYMPVWGKEFWLGEGADEAAEIKARKRIEALVKFLDSIQIVEDDPAARASPQG